MTNGDMRYGRCSVCGGGEVYHGEYAASGGGLRPMGDIVGKRAWFDAFVCVNCGHTQLHVRLNPKLVSYVRSHLTWIPPRDGTG